MGDRAEEERVAVHLANELRHSREIEVVTDAKSGVFAVRALGKRWIVRIEEWPERVAQAAAVINELSDDDAHADA